MLWLNTLVFLVLSFWVGGGKQSGGWGDSLGGDMLAEFGSQHPHKIWGQWHMSATPALGEKEGGWGQEDS